MLYYPKRILHKLFKKRFQPSLYYCLDCGNHVRADHTHKTSQLVGNSRDTVQFPGHIVVSFGRRQPRFWNRRVKREMGKVPSIRKFLDPTIVRPKIWDWRNVNGVDYTDGEGSSQDTEGACTGFGGARFKGIMEKIAGTWVGKFSERFIYNCARFIGGLLGQEGAYMIDVMNGLKQYGACLARYWPFKANSSDHDDWPPPNSNALKDALNWRINEFADCMIDEDGSPAKDPVGNILDAIYQLGGVDAGIPWVQSWEAPWNGDCPLPGDNEEVLGGHSIGIVGYDEVKGIIYFRNSWTSLWGNKGDGSFPLESVLVFRDHLGGCEFYRAVDAESHVCPEGQHWDEAAQACVDDGVGPQPTTCEDTYNEEMPKCLALTEIFAMLFCAFEKIINYYICAFGLLLFRKALGSRKTKTLSKTFLTKGGAKFKMTITITEPKKKRVLSLVRHLIRHCI